MKLHPQAGKPAPDSLRLDVPRLVSTYYTLRPDPTQRQQRVSFGTSGHRGSSLGGSFNEAHIVATTQAICDYRREQGVSGPLFLGVDTHALSVPAFATALEVLAANEVPTYIDRDGEYTPTPVVSHAILTYNGERRTGHADGIVITPSHNPPQDGGFKYNPPHGGPAASDVTSWIESRANACLESRLQGVRRMAYEKALRAPTTHLHDFIGAYVEDLEKVVDVEAIRGIHIGVDPLGGSSLPCWEPIASRYGLRIEVVNERVDPTFSFMCLDWDGKIRMDCSSPHAMAGLIAMRERFDLAFGNDPDADRHGIVTPRHGLMNPNHYLAVVVDYLFRERPQWSADVAVGKTLVSSSLIDRVAARLGRRLVEVPVGFKWFVSGLQDGSLGFAGEESAGAAFLRRDGRAWTTDKDGMLLGLLAAEIMARRGRDPGELYDELVRELGEPVYERRDAAATYEQKSRLQQLQPGEIEARELAGEPVRSVLTTAPGNDAPIGGIKVVTDNGWFAARPSGTEEVYKIYAESFRGREHLQALQAEAEALLSRVFARG
jgi:phosphoglucomutase